MAIVTYSEEASYILDTDSGSLTYSDETTYFTVRNASSVAYTEEETFFDPNAGGGATQRVVNRVWDTVEGGFVWWTTAEVDSAGASYPGPGTFGVDTSNYVVELVAYTA